MTKCYRCHQPFEPYEARAVVSPPGTHFQAVVHKRCLIIGDEK